MNNYNNNGRERNLVLWREKFGGMEEKLYFCVLFLSAELISLSIKDRL